MIARKTRNDLCRFFQSVACYETLCELPCSGGFFHPPAHPSLAGQCQQEFTGHAVGSAPPAAALSRRTGSLGLISMRGTPGTSAEPPAPSSRIRLSDGSSRVSQEFNERLYACTALARLRPD